MDNKTDKYKLISAAIFILSLSLRLSYLYQIKSTPLFDFFAMDSEYYDRAAIESLNGNFIFKEAIYLSPLYPFILSIIYWVFGHSLIAAGLCQAVSDSLICISIYFICVKIFKKNIIGLTASFIYAGYNIAIFYTGFLVDTTFSVFFSTASILTILYADKRKKSGLWFFSSALLGMSMLLRANIILFVPFFIFWLYRHKNIELKTKTIDLAYILIGILITITPFSIRNYMVGKSLSPFPLHGGLNFYIGSHPGATGSYTSLIGISDSPITQIKQSIFMARKEAGKYLSYSEVSKHWFLKGLDFIKNSPRQYFSLMLKKFLLFWNKEEVSPDINFYFCKRFLPILNLPLFSFGIIAPFAMLGLILAIKQREDGAYLVILFIFAYMVSLIAFFVTSRYRFPCIPFIVIMSSYGLYAFLDVIKAHKIKQVFFYSAVISISFFVVNKDMDAIDSKNDFYTSYNNLGTIYQKKGMINEAIIEHKKAIEINPSYAQAHNNLGAAYYNIGNSREAIDFYKKAINLNPYFVEAYYGLANIFSDTADYKDAIVLYKKAIEFNPDYAIVYNNLGTAYANIGEIEKAIDSFKKAIELTPDYAKAYNNLGVIYAGMGRKKEAISLFKKAIEIDPAYKDAYSNLKLAVKQETP